MVAASRPNRWADEEIEESEEMVSDSLAQLLDDTSYREAPLASLEDSRKGLNLQLSSSEVGPKDFTFLLESQAAREEPDSKVSLAAWTPNLEAPEFIPTLSMACPLVGVCLAEEVGKPSLCDELQENQSECSATVSTASTFSAAYRSTPAKMRRGSTSNSDEMGITPEKTLQVQTEIHTPSRGKNRKRRPATLQLQDLGKKRTKSEERKAALVSPVNSCSSLGTMRGRNFSGLSDTSSCVQSEATEATEEEWEHRAEMRSKAISLGKATAEYQRYASLKKPSERQEGEPSTPNPLDRSISKRAWKFATTQWRNALLKYAVDEACPLQN
mmetsp:Transcript_73953/g.130631  ORF Transcript_73953/g.130631 Transcript_73953/m.130631 type:complete len:328 (+) Transcript_73953:85-1068(+)